MGVFRDLLFETIRNRLLDLFFLELNERPFRVKTLRPDHLLPYR